MYIRVYICVCVSNYNETCDKQCSVETDYGGKPRTKVVYMKKYEIDMKCLLSLGLFSPFSEKHPALPLTRVRYSVLETSPFVIPLC